MRIRSLGHSGLALSAVGLGTRTWGLDTEHEECDEMLRAFVGAGGTYVHVEDDQNYPAPLATLGRLIENGAPRQKLHIGLESGRFGDAPVGPSRGQLLSSLDNALQTLHTDYVDIWIARGPRRSVPLNETLTALRTAYQSGKARYVGLSGFSEWDGGQSVGVAQGESWEISAWSRPVSLLQPIDYDSNFNALIQNGLGIIAGSPLCGGLLTGKYRHSTPADSRAASPRFRKELADYMATSRNGIVEGLVRAADGLDKSPAQVALSWSMNVPGVTTAVVGPRSTAQLRHLLEVEDWQLPTAIEDVLTEISKDSR